MKELVNDYKLVQSQIKEIRDSFEDVLANKLNLIRASAPIIVSQSSGLNDRLSGIENAIDFYVPNLNENLEIVQSLAKWKRVALKKYKIPPHEGIYTNMNALRKDETLDNIHSIYVDQWDWEARINLNDRNITFLRTYVENIYSAILTIFNKINEKYKININKLPEKIKFISSQELEDAFPKFTSKEREHEAAKKYGAIFIHGIGNTLKSGKPHDSRSPDYDDWDLNGDLILWSDALGTSIEISSMGIRVDADSLLRQLTITDDLDRMKFQYHQDIVNNALPYTIGGGIGQSRLCMFILSKKHIGEVQCSVWDSDTINNPKYKIL
ncbi:MAG: aspartate--ammonia ligase [Mycoplasma sp.]